MYQNKKNLTMAKLVEKNEDSNQVKLVAADGSEIVVTISTFKRWWKKVGDENVAMQEIIPDEQVQVLEDKSTEVEVSFSSVEEVLANLVASGKKVYVNDAVEAVKKAGFQVNVEDIQEYLENGNGVQQGKDKKEEKKPRVKKEKTPKHPANDQIPAIKEFIRSLTYDLGGEIFNSNVVKNVDILKVGGHMFARVNYSKHRALVCCRESVVNGIFTPDEIIKHTFDAGYNFTDLQERKELVEQLLRTSFDAQVEKNKVKMDKAAKKAVKVEKEVA